MKEFESVLLLLGIAVPATGTRAWAQEMRSKELCAVIGRTDLSLLMDAPTQLTASELVGAQEKSPEYCRVNDYVAPQVGFEIRSTGAKSSSCSAAVDGAGASMGTHATATLAEVTLA
jgi:hypothetical protein